VSLEFLNAAIDFRKGNLIIALLNYFFQRQRPEEMNLKPDFGKSAPEKSAPRVKALSEAGPSEGSAAQLAILGFCVGLVSRSDSVAHGTDSPGRCRDRRGVFKRTGRAGAWCHRTFYRAGDDSHGNASRSDRPPTHLLGSASLVVGIFILTMITDASRNWLLYLFPPFIAVGFSSRQSLYPTIAADLFHGKSFGALIGAISLFIGASDRSSAHRLG
jgi:hypothetical protein